MTWKSVNLGSIIPSDWTYSAKTAAGFIDKYAAVAQATIDAGRLIQRRVTDRPDLLAIAVKGLIDTLEGFLQLGKAHVLYIPIVKVTGTNGMMQGGAEGFERIFQTAMDDYLDPNRPQYLEDTDAVVMGVVLAGAPTYAGALNIASSFTRIFRPPADNDLTGHTMPRPQNLRAKTVAHPAAEKVAVKLDWDPPPAGNKFFVFYGTGTSVTRYAVIRSTSTDILKAHSVLDLFGTQALTEGMSDSSGDHVVVDIGTGTNSSFVDSSNALNPAKSYYYAVAWELSVKEPDSTTVMPFDVISNVVKTRVKAIPPTASAVPPNWHALPSLAQLVPPLADGLFMLAQYLKTISTRSHGPHKGLAKALTMVETQVNRIAGEIHAINTSFEKIVATLNIPTPGVYGTVMYGEGGNAFLKAALTSALADPADGSRPQYTNNEFVTGFCIVAGGPRIPDIQPIIDFLNLILGTTSTQEPLLGILSILEGAVTQAESAVFGADMQPLPYNPDGTVQTTEGTSVVPGGIDPLTGAITATVNPVIGEDGTAVSGSSSTNPLMGNTNVTPLRDLC